jgi:hypothetical protein
MQDKDLDAAINKGFAAARETIKQSGAVVLDNLINGLERLKLAIPDKFDFSETPSGALIPKVLSATGKEFIPIMSIQVFSDGDFFIDNELVVSEGNQDKTVLDIVAKVAEKAYLQILENAKPSSTKVPASRAAQKFQGAARL